MSEFADVDRHLNEIPPSKDFLVLAKKASSLRREYLQLKHDKTTLKLIKTYYKEMTLKNLMAIKKHYSFLSRQSKNFYLEIQKVIKELGLPTSIKSIFFSYNIMYFGNQLSGNAKKRLKWDKDNRNSGMIKDYKDFLQRFPVNIFKKYQDYFIKIYADLIEKSEQDYNDWDKKFGSNKASRDARSTLNLLERYAEILGDQSDDRTFRFIDQDLHNYFRRYLKEHPDNPFSVQFKVWYQKHSDYLHAIGNNVGWSAYNKTDLKRYQGWMAKSIRDFKVMIKKHFE
jgi:hypothetical protein